jgi:hypothetical protein
MTRDERMDRALDAALEMTFPASDPIAVYMEEPRTRAAEEKVKARPEASLAIERSSVVHKRGARIRRHPDDAVRAGVTRTPSFFVNGRTVRPLSEERWRRTPETALLPG